MTKRQRFQLPKENKVSAVDPEKVAAFVQGTLQVAAFVQGTLHEGSLDLPWGSLDPKAKPTSGINLRLNEYQLALLRFVAEHEDRSQQQVTKRMLVPSLEARAQEIVDNQTSG